MALKLTEKIRMNVDTTLSVSWLQKLNHPSRRSASLADFRFRRACSAAESSDKFAESQHSPQVAGADLSQPVSTRPAARPIEEIAKTHTQGFTLREKRAVTGSASAAVGGGSGVTEASALLEAALVAAGCAACHQWLRKPWHERASPSAQQSVQAWSLDSPA